MLVRAPRAGCWSTTSATARRRCSAGCRRAGRCGRWSRPSSPTRPDRRWPRAWCGSAAVAFGSWLLGPRCRRRRRARASLAARSDGGGASWLIGLPAWTCCRRPQPPLPDRRPGARVPGCRARLVRPRDAPLRRAVRARCGSSTRGRGRADAGGERAPGPASRAAADAGAAQRPLLAAGRPATACGVRWAARDPLPARGRPRSRCRWAASARRCGSGRSTPVARRRVDAEFWLPVDAGLRRIPRLAELERSIDELRIEAIDVVDAGVRTPTPQVLAAAAYGRTIVLFHDERRIRSRAGSGPRASGWRALDDRLSGRLRARRRPCACTAGSGRTGCG